MRDNKVNVFNGYGNKTEMLSITHTHQYQNTNKADRQAIST